MLVSGLIVLVGRRLPAFYSSALFSSKSSRMNVDLGSMRKQYESPELNEASLPSKDPITLFRMWFDIAKEASSGIDEANAMILSTSDPISGTSSARVVLLKGFGPEGFQFFTNYSSQKGRELQMNPKACVLFYWGPLHRQIRIEGEVVKLPREVSEEYFHSRPRGSQLSALVSKQSTVIPGRESLECKYQELEKQYGNGEIPIPEEWGGYILKAHTIEFWQGRPNRFHDRIRFRKAGKEESNPDGILCHAGENGWVFERLAP